MGAYISQVGEYYGDVTFRDHGLSASEGRMTTPLEANTCHGILDVAPHYYEFIPEEEHGTPNPTILEGHELEVDRNYFLVVTTSSAIYRYDMHDVVRCVGFEGQAPILEFLNKGANYSSMTGEKLSEIQVVHSVRAALAEVGVTLEHFTLAPVPGDPPGYALLVEADWDGETQRRVARALDRQLAEANCEYDNRLETHRLKPVEIQQIPPGTWKAYHAGVLTKAGASVEQFKHPCLVNKLEFIDQLLGSPALART